MPRHKEGRFDSLMAGDAGVSPNIEALQIAHSGLHSILRLPVGPRMGPQPAFGRPVTALAGDAFADFEGFAAESLWDFAQGGMTSSTAVICHGVVDSERFANLFGPGSG